MGTVFVLNAVALYLFPVMGHAMHMSQAQFGTWAGVAIHDISSVVGAASHYGLSALQTATAVKLSRALWIVPVAFGAAYAFRPRSAQATDDGHATGPTGKPTVKIPWFVGFLPASPAWRVPTCPGSPLPPRRFPVWRPWCLTLTPFLDRRGPLCQDIAHRRLAADAPGRAAVGVHQRRFAGHHPALCLKPLSFFTSSSSAPFQLCIHLAPKSSVHCSPAAQRLLALPRLSLRCPGLRAVVVSSGGQFYKENQNGHDPDGYCDDPGRRRTRRRPGPGFHRADDPAPPGSRRNGQGGAPARDRPRVAQHRAGGRGPSNPSRSSTCKKSRPGWPWPHRLPSPLPPLARPRRRATTASWPTTNPRPTPVRNFQSRPKPRPADTRSLDRVYTGDQVSNTVSVIDPSTNQLLGLIKLGELPPGGPGCRSTRDKAWFTAWASRRTARACASCPLARTRSR